MQIPTLATDRLSLVPPDQACEELYRRFYIDAEASKAYGGPLTPGAAWNRLASDIGTWALQGFGVWAIREPKGDGLVGVCGFWQGLGWPRELTWWLLPQARGRGIAKEASLAAIERAYEVWKWESVRTYMQDENHEARALVLRLGGSKIRRQLFPDGLERDVFHIPRHAVGAGLAQT
jgi:[ribosomal protein S5]-alanine N-acetyltransferase